MKDEDIKLVANNKKARHDYFIEKIYEAGLVLKGTEVKSIRQGRVNLKESYVIVKDGEVFVFGMHISPYKEGNIFNEDPLRTRKLLLNKNEIRKISQDVKLAGSTVVPLRLYFRNGRAKLEIALAKGKKLYDKRESQRERDIKRSLDRKYKI
ncbi:MAG: SsrA-binding protein SmpB [Eubacteriales bacterium]|uniref:SsrA-binding protein SmpB n=1 Tax=Fenollaria sp. TaxID=1965292 RepID=UPI002A758883|nr:SsrA-binding protein SmpB [Fenollaria sp.]MDD7339639.1 SsrA-binding protein SmpB [Eubacteriales bacterium]MDY3105682.1 SsrA-binding protein SmpB [Fenollaria sp.]